MDNRSLIRELSLISLGLISDKDQTKTKSLEDINFDEILESAIETMVSHCRQELDQCQSVLENASQNLMESELIDFNKNYFDKTRDQIKQSFTNLELVMNILSDSLDFPELIAMRDQKNLKTEVNHRVSKVVNNFSKIDSDIDNAMEGWRFKRLPRIDRDILRLAYVDISFLDIPISVACNEAVNLANKYGDTQGRKMINGVLRRLQRVKLK